MLDSKRMSWFIYMVVVIALTNVTKGVIQDCAVTLNASIPGGLSPVDVDGDGQYENNVDCRLTIIAANNQVVRFKIISLDLENSTACNHDYIKVYDGSSVKSPLIGTYCGNTLPPTIIGTSNTMYVIFHTDGSVTAGGFNATYEQTYGCGGTLSSTQGALTSLDVDGDGKYENYLDCRWTIIAVNNQVIRFRITSLDLENNTACNYDYIKVYDGSSVNSPLIGTYCGNTLPPTIIGTSNTMYVIFHTDGSVTAGGFNATYEHPYGCGGTLSSTQGALTSLDVDGDGKYENYLDCRWTIIAVNNQVIRFRITSLDLENNTACNYDYIKVYDGSSVNSPLIGTYCGNTLPPTIIGTSNTMYVIFHTDGSVTAGGFNATYEQTYGCGGTLSSTQGALTSLDVDGDGKYENYLDCRWTIIAVNNQVIRFRITSLDLENNTACNYDYIKVYDGSSVNSPLIGSYCGNTLPPTIIGTSNTMYVMFHTDSSVMASGFNARYEQTYGCGGTLNSAQGALTSPDVDGDGKYENYLDCRWTISAVNNQVVRFRITSLDLENNTACNYDYIKVYDGSSVNSPLIGSYCGNTLPPTIIGTSNTMYVIFHTDSSKTASGFNATYEQTYGCGGTLNSAQGALTSLDVDGDGKYENYLDCRWTISAVINQVIRFRITSLDLENNTACNYDYIKVYDGSSVNSPLIRTYCGNTLPPTIISTSNTMYVIFHTDGSGTASGFNATYEQTYGCGGTLSSTQGVFASPDVDGDGEYENNLYCRWTIVAANNQVVRFKIISLDLENNTACNYDYLKVYDGNNANAPLMDTYCGNTLPPPVFTTANFLYVVFRTDSSVTATGFTATYEQIYMCGGMFTADHATILSPGYPNSYSNYLNCTYTIVVDPKKFIELTFDPTIFDTEGPPCIFDSLSVYDGNDASGSPLGIFCGTTVPQPISVLGTMVLRFTTDGSVTGRGFNISYTTQDTYRGCGGYLNNTQGEITSFDADGDGEYENFVECRWTIVAADDEVGRFTIIDIDLVNSTGCTLDYIKVYNGMDYRAPLIGQYCGDTLPPPIVATSKFLYVIFHTDGTGTRTGFNATYGRMNAPVTTVTIINKNSYIFTDGQDTNVTCKTGVSDPHAVITWSIISGINLGNGTTINNSDGTTTSILQYTADKSDDKNTLLCTATNGYGSPKIDAVTLDIRYPPMVQLEPTCDQYRVIEGRQLLLNCTIDEANPPAQFDGYTWSWNNIKIKGQNTSVFRLESVNRSDNGNYTCTGSNSAGPGNSSTPLQVDVLYPPLVSTPYTYQVIESTDLILQCTATGNPSNYDYSWAGPGDMNATGSSFNISNIDRERSGDYKCTSTNILIPTTHPQEIGTGSSTTHVTVLYGPRVTILSDNSTTEILEHTHHRLFCTVQSNPTPTNFTWYLPNDTTSPADTDLVISTRNQGGIYRCEATTILKPTNGIPITRSHNKTVNITILYLDEVRISLDNNKLEGSEGHPVSISCSCNSNPVALITWYNGTTKLSSAQSNNDTFTIQQATCLDTGDYICNVKNGAIPQLEYNRTIELRMICSPRQDTRCLPTPIVSGNITDIVQLVADVISYPPPTFTWYYNNITTGDVEPIYNDDVYEQIDTNSSINTYRSTLNINITSNIFYTSYTVNVSNDIGYMELEYQVKPQLKSPIPQTSEASHTLLMVASGVGVLVFIVIIISVVVTLVLKLKQRKTSEEEPSPYDTLNMDTIKTNDTDSTYKEVWPSSTGITGHYTKHPQTNQNYGFEDSATYENPNMGEHYQDVGNVRTPVDKHEDDFKHTYINTKKGDNPEYATVDKRKWNEVYRPSFLHQRE